MISRNYVAHLFSTQRVWLGASFLLVGMFQVLMMVMVETLDLPSILEGVIQMLPLPAQQLFGDQFISDYSVGGIVALAYKHPLILVTFLLVAISLPVRHLAGAVENGTLELILAMPVPRLRIARSLWAGSGLFLLVLLLGCWVGMGISMLIFPETRSLHLPTLAKLGVNLWLLAFAISSYAFLSSALSREAARATQLAAGLTLFFYFLDYAVQIWPAIEVVRWLTPFNYFDTQDILRGGTGWIRDGVVLATVAIASGGLALLQVHRRDIP